MTALVIVFTGFNLSHGQNIVNLLTNPGLEDGTLNGWGGYGDNTREVVQDLVGAAVPSGPIEGNYCLHVTVGDGAANFWDSGLTLWGGNLFESGKQYTFSFWLKSKEGDRDINIKPEQNGTWTAYGEKRVTMTEEWAEYYTTTPVMTADVPNVQISVHVGFGPGEFWVDAAKLYVGEYLETVFGPQVKAKKPNPPDGAADVAQDVILGWQAGPSAATHDVYFGTSFDDVNNAPTVDTLALLVSKGQTETTYDPDGLLEFDKTYYWRIDEVNAPPDSTVFKGDVWSFTVEPFAYPITNIAATASSSNSADMGPEKTIDGSGLSAGGQHSVEPTHMWLSSIMPNAPQPTWIQYEFDKPYQLFEMSVWNSNQLIEPSIGFGMKDVTVEYSEDGVNWTLLGDVEFARASGLPTYVANTTIDMSGILAKYVRLTAKSNWGGILNQYGLSEVQFSFIPVQARAPIPALRQTDVDLDVVLDWRSGREATSHDVYFSTDKDAVVNGTALAATVTESSYQPGTLEYGQRYYWKVDEVNEAAPTPIREGQVWSFSTVESFIVEDFEGYNPAEPIWESWLDGLGFGAAGTPGFNAGNGTGSAVGDDTTASFTEETIVHGGSQAMPLFYNNSKPGFANYSETEHTLAQTGDWTKNGVTQLSLWFRGYPGSVGSFAEGPAGTFTVTGSGADIWDTADQFHYAFKTLTGPGSIVAKVESLENSDPWAKAGVMIRDSLEPGSKHAFACITPSNGVASQGRVDTDGASFSTAQADVTAPYWLKLERSISGTFTVSHSANGTTWTPVANSTPTNIQMGLTVYIGLAVTSHNAALSCEASFSNVTMTGTVSGQWMNQDIGIAANDAQTLYVGIADTAGNVAVVEHKDPSASQIDTWTKWAVNLSEFADQGVNLAGVQKIIIGLGNRTNPVAGGSGTLFIDDIAVGNPVPAETEYVNLLTNGGFEDGVLAPWGLWGDAGAEVVSTLTGAAVPEGVIEGSSCLHVTVNSAGTNFWDSGLNQGGYVFEAGKNYTLSAFLKCSSGTMDINFKPELAADPWSGYGEQVITMTDEWAEYSVTTPVFAADTSPGNITFHIGFGPGDFWMDNVRFYEGDYVAP